ncbi:MAG: DUF4834 family protein [Alistipes sp.]|nr:DUF4834 family protein [Alistipes sp.]
MFLEELWTFIKRNIFAIVLAVTVMVAVPWTIIFILPVAAIFILFLVVTWRLRKASKQMYEEAQRQAGSQQQTRNSWRRKTKEEGEVTVVQTEQTEQRVNDEVGEYVDFKEIKD